MALLGRNRYFPIYVDVNGVKTPFEGLVLKKSVVDSTLMSLGDNITGNVYYPNNALPITLHEYIEYKNNPDDPEEESVRYTLVNPPTIVREGLVADNSENKGMTKYSFVFYHPMFQLNNMPFTDIAVTQTEEKHKSADKSFSWVGHLDDFVAKLNKNLEETIWHVELSPRVPQEVVDKLSDVLSFSNTTIGEALKQAYETWEVPFVISPIKQREMYYSQGKRFQILLGLPANEIFASDEDRQASPPRPFVFKMGKGVGLKNSSATPRNNKIVTRIAGYGSENNIPYGYPQIRWWGDQRWEWTKYVNNDPQFDSEGKPQGTPAYDAFPIYEGIVGGAVVKLIKHPFTRTHLMPSVYVQTLFNRVSPYLERELPNGALVPNPNYSNTTSIIDYYDAISSEQYPYPNEINPLAPSYEVHEFADIKPELGEEYIINAYPIANDLTPQSAWNDEMDGEGNYVQSYFKVKLPVLSFDIYACAAITQEMQINMRSGACIGCTFTVQVDWEEYKQNFYDSDLNFLPNGTQRDLSKYPRSDQEQIELILQKDMQTFGTLMPNMYQYPQPNDQFVILGISLPLSYIENAQQRLDESMKSYMLENNVHYFDYPLKFDEKFLYDNTHILAQIRNNTIIRFQNPQFLNQDIELFVKQISIKFGEGVLPQYDITLTDDVSVVLNQIGQAQEQINKLSYVLSELRQTYNRNVWFEIARKLSKVNDDTAQGLITFNRGTKSKADSEWGDWVQDSSGAAIWQDEQKNWHVEGDFLHARRKLIAKEVQIEDVHHVGGQQLLTAASMTVDFVVERDDCWRCFFLKRDAQDREVYNKWVVGDQAYVCTFNLKVSDIHTEAKGDVFGNHYLWRLVTNTSNTTTDVRTYLVNGELLDASKYHFIDLSKTNCGLYSDAPWVGDEIVQLGNQNGELDRQNAIVVAGAGSASPYIRQYTNITSFTLPTPDTQIKPNDNVFTGVVNIQAGSKLQNGDDVNTIVNNLVGGQVALQEDVANLNSGNYNLLLNTGFTGDFQTNDVQASTNFSEDTQVYSPKLKYWNCRNVEVVQDVASASGYAAVIDDGTLRQQATETLLLGEPYSISFKAKGAHVMVSIGGYKETIALDTEYSRKTFKLICTNVNDNVFTLDGVCTIAEIQLVKGNVPNADWLPSPKDNNAALAYMQNLSYLTNAITNASTTILGGLILTQMLRVGNYRDGVMQQDGETGGMSGVYSSEQSPFLWGGGSMEQAFYTIAKYAQDPSYQPTEQEVKRMAKFVVTHGGRAILNDIVLRGYVYALGGYFRGSLEAGTSDKLLIDAATGILRMNGHASIIDGTTDTPDETAERIDFLKLFYQVDPDSLYRIGRLLLNSKLGNVTLDAVNGLFGTNGYASMASTVKVNVTNGFEHSNPLNKIMLGNGELVISDLLNDAQVRFDGNSIKWYVNGRQTMGGTITVDANGFLKVLNN